TVLGEQRTAAQSQRVRRQTTTNADERSPEVAELTLEIDVELREGPLTAVRPPGPRVGEGVPVVEYGAWSEMPRSDPGKILRPVRDFLNSDVVDFEAGSAGVECISVTHWPSHSIELQPRTVAGQRCPRSVIREMVCVRPLKVVRRGSLGFRDGVR